MPRGIIGETVLSIPQDGPTVNGVWLANLVIGTTSTEKGSAREGEEAAKWWGIGRLQPETAVVVKPGAS
jgi:hypothetical protein